MIKSIKKMFAIIAALTMISVCVSVSAASITVTLSNETITSSNKAMAVYPVLVEDDDQFFTGLVEKYNVFAAYEDADEDTIENAMAYTLGAYVIRDNVKPSYSLKQDTDGKLKLSGISKGMYLVLDTEYYTSRYATAIKPHVVSIEDDDTDFELVINQDEAQSNFVVSKHVNVEFSIDDIYKDACTIPDLVTVQLLKNGEAVKETVLSVENNWQCDFTELNDSSSYQIVEKDIPNNFGISVYDNGSTVTILNQATMSVSDLNNFGAAMVSAFSNMAENLQSSVMAEAVTIESNEESNEAVSENLESSPTATPKASASPTSSPSPSVSPSVSPTATSNAEAPKTGDNNLSVWLYIIPGVAMLGLGAAVWLYAKKRTY